MKDSPEEGSPLIDVCHLGQIASGDAHSFGPVVDDNPVRIDAANSTLT
jgi:hypothetical protein